ncbi:endo-1,4-beta-xylanase [Paenibacillus woosongensis]|uniref:Beta-xylanase n=1 Tax=Paenibacillus woosongensis TaxID=307580 RepID=A0AA95L2B1_9BACL|nr:endo-1,4-beta-xylanase [Paenibacillus woosongensis]WHX49347.1 endo-1,4-beta-xylanase [Paenibacillus woosongensis]
MGKMFKQGISILLAVILLIPLGWLPPEANAAAPSATNDAVTVYHETFAGGQGAATQSGGAQLAPVTSKVFDGNDDGAALYVSNRTNDYDAVDFKFADIHLINGKTYTVTASVYVDANESIPSGAQAVLLTVNSYGNWTGVNYEAGKAVTLTREFTVDTSKDTALRIQSNDEGASVPFYIGDILITEKANSGGGNPEPPRPPAKDFTTITFEDGTTGGFEGRAGTETLNVTEEANHTEGGSRALKVEGRTSTWHGPSLRVEEYVDKGSEYKISAWVKLIDPASSQLQLSTQIGNGGSANYVALAPKTINASDGWVQFEGTYRYNSVGDEYLTIYVESSNNAAASFYIDDISFEKTSAGPIDIEKDLLPIKDVYQSDFLIGSAISAEDLDGVRLELLKMHHNVATAGNAMKPDALQPSKGDFTFDAADAMVDKILAEGMQMHGHVLVWHQQSPAWMNTTTDAAGNTAPLSRDEALANLRAHIRTVVEHFGDRVISWDVVNEAMNDNPPNPSDWKEALRKAPWYQAIGPDYIEQAFLAAREVLDEKGWDIKLYYNDYNDDNQNKAEAIYSMVKEINENYAKTHPGKLLIDGVGMQGHYSVNTNPANVKLSLEKFISLGVEVSVTELDIQAGSNYQLSDQLANAQCYLYAELFKIYKEHADHIARVTFWGLDDATSWRASSNPLLFDKNLQAKPAYYGVINPDKFIEEHQPETGNANQSTAKFATPVIDGTVDAVWNDTPGMPINRYQMAWQGANGVAKALWDDKNLYVLIQVSDSQLDKSSANVWEHDSVEVFLDENNAKTSFYQDDDGQYRINFANETSFNPPSLAEGFESAVQVSGSNYTVEMKIPFKTITPANNMKVGFDAQINDAKDGARQSVATWNDTTGNGYQDTSVYGVLSLIGKPAAPGGSNSGGSGSSSGSTNSGSGSAPQEGNVESKDGVVTIKPGVKVDNGRATATISEDTLSKALEQTAPAANGKKQIVIDVPEQAEAASYEVQLPAQSLKGQEAFQLLLKTDQATLQIPSGLLSNAAVDADQVSVRVGAASTEGWSAAARERIGSHPAIDLSITAGDNVIAWNNPDAPITVAIPYTPSAEELNHPEQIVVLYIDGNGNATAIPNGRYDAAAGTVVFQTDHFGSYAVAFSSKSFGDLHHVPWAKRAIDALAARDIIQGTDDSSFSPEAAINRADFLALLIRTLELKGTGRNEAAFSDVPSTAYYSHELAIARELGIAAGFADNTFRPDTEISRQDMMALAARALAAAGKLSEGTAALDAYTDAESVADYAKDSIAALVKSGIIAGKNDKLAPHDSLNRAEAAAILYRIWKL